MIPTDMTEYLRSHLRYYDISLFCWFCSFWKRKPIKSMNQLKNILNTIIIASWPPPVWFLFLLMISLVSYVFVSKSYRTPKMITDINKNNKMKQYKLTDPDSSQIQNPLDPRAQARGRIVHCSYFDSGGGSRGIGVSLFLFLYLLICLLFIFLDVF